MFGALIVAAGIVGNALAFVLPIDYAAFGSYLYPGIFLLTFLANASVVVPVPYVPVVIRAAEAAPSVALVIAAAAAGSMLGEAVSFFVGRAGKRIVAGSRVYRMLHRFVDRPLVAGLFLFLLAAPLNPLFDVAGIAAGALGIRFEIFAISVFLGRLARFAAVVWLGLGLTRI